MAKHCCIAGLGQLCASCQGVYYGSRPASFSKLCYSNSSDTSCVEESVAGNSWIKNMAVSVLSGDEKNQVNELLMSIIQSWTTWREQTFGELQQKMGAPATPIPIKKGQTKD